jgi:SAM-dependent methyltransferase
MTTAKTGAVGYAPKVIIQPAPKKDEIEEAVPGLTAKDLEKILPNYTEEQKKYIQCWDLPDYRRYSPGEELVDLFLETAEPAKGTTVIDWGCGTGRAAKKIYEDGDELDVTAVDFAYNCLDKPVKELAKNNDRFRFIEEDLTKTSGLQSDFGFCTDVLEHIPEQDIDFVLSNILYASKHVFFQISTAHDIFSDHPDLDLNSPDDVLHHTVHDYFWWLQKFVDQSVYIHHSNDLGGAVIFYVTGWSARALSWEGGYVNTDAEKVKENMTANAKLGIQPILPCGGDGETEIMILCGGPSLNDFEDEIRQKREDGVKLITVNGSYNWCLERGLKPSMQCMIDARPFMLRMVEQVPGLTDETKYAIASQCDPSIFEVVPHDRTYMWQVSMSEGLIPHIKECFGEMYKDWFPSPGGSTVALRAIVLMRILGFNKMYIYGMDSCIFPDTDRNHHAYDQPENDDTHEQGVIPIVVGGGTRFKKTFYCEPWMAFQAREFQLMVPAILDDVQLQIKGDGLLAYWIETAAKVAEEEDS